LKPAPGRPTPADQALHDRNRQAIVKRPLQLPMPARRTRSSRRTAAKHEQKRARPRNHEYLLQNVTDVYYLLKDLKM
jgi:hypothetical protein